MKNKNKNYGNVKIEAAISKYQMDID